MRKPTAAADPRTAAARQVADALPAFILLQAFMAGRSQRLFGTWSITAHGTLGTITFLISLLLLVLVTVGRVGRRAAVVGGAVVVLLTAQLGLGYAGRRSVEAAAWHVPLGVALFGLAVYQSLLIRGTRGACGVATEGNSQLTDDKLS